MDRVKLNDEEVLRRLGSLKGWTFKRGSLSKEFKFKDFNLAFAFMTKSAAVAEEINHHPDWCNVYNKVNVELSTHDVRGITEFDFKLAEKMNEFS